MPVYLKSSLLVKILNRLLSRGSFEAADDVYVQMAHRLAAVLSSVDHETCLVFAAALCFRQFLRPVQYTVCQRSVLSFQLKQAGDVLFRDK